MTQIFKNATAIVLSAGLITGLAAVPMASNASTSYVCKYEQKQSGKKGMLVGALAGGALGGTVADTHNKGLGTVVGALAGAAVGSKMGKDHAKANCRQEEAYRERTVYHKDSRGRTQKVVYRYIRQ